MSGVKLGIFARPATTFRALFSILRHVSNGLRMPRASSVFNRSGRKGVGPQNYCTVPDKSIREVRGDDSGRGRTAQARTRVD